MREQEMQRSVVFAVCFGFAMCFGPLAAPTAAVAQQPENIVLNEKDTKQLSPHVWALFGNPNIGIVVGSRGTLVVDTGLGRRNGATVAGVASKLSKSSRLFLTTTHFHPEHVTGQSGFPADTVVIRPNVQQKELEESGAAMIDFFRSRSDVNKELLVDAGIDKSDILFDNELTVDLGDVTARLLWFGPAHTNGDMVVLVEPDKVLISGDVAQNKFTILPIGTQSTIKSWLAVLDRVADLKPALILPDHSPPGDSAMIGEQRAYMTDLLERAKAIKSEGKSAEDATRLISAEFAAKYPGWLRPGNLTRAAMQAYREAP
jgi:glyoxylase-like metal-dependent hydrolase (beta-lactamase superfamily II)